MKSLYVEPTNACNQKCSFCFQSTGDMTRKQGMMTPRTFNKVLDTATSYDQLIMHHSGESMLHPDIIKMVKKAKKRGYNVAMTTNGTIPISELLDNADHVSISLGEKRNADVVVSTVGNWATLLARKKMSWGGIIDAPSSILKKIAFRIMLLFRISICKAVDVGPAILWDGTVVPCCLDYNADIKLGNIFDKQLDDIIKSADWLRNGLSGKTKMPARCVSCKL